MTRTPRVGGLFSGVGGFEQGFVQAGFELAYQCEIDPHAQSILRRHFPGTPLYDDITALNPRELPWVDVIVGGWPCQDHSVAGARKGFDGQKSSLFRELARIVSDRRPSFVVAENVPGLLSQPRELGEILRTFTQLGYLGAWRVLDAQHFGVPQRRRRLFFVAGRGTLGARAAEVLFERPCGAGHPPPGRAASPDLAGTLGAGTPRRGWNGDADRMTFLPVWKRRGGYGWSETNDQAPTLESQGGSHQGGPENIPLVSMVPDATNPLLPVTGASDHGRSGKGAESDATDPMIVVSVSENQRAELRTSPTCPQLSTGGGKIGQGYAAIAFHTRQDPISGAVAPALDSDMTTSALRVRRLTPRECERLMGWPDDYTRFTHDDRELTDGHRYRLIGNGVVTPVAAWIARRLRAVLEE